MGNRSHGYSHPTTASPSRVAGWAGAAVFILGLICAGPAAAQQEELWVQLLREQLLDELGCKLNYTTNVRKFELGGEQMVEARAHCFDKRAFDARWLPDEGRYEIRSCEPTVC